MGATCPNCGSHWTEYRLTWKDYRCRKCKHIWRPAPLNVVTWQEYKAKHLIPKLYYREENPPAQSDNFLD